MKAKTQLRVGNGGRHRKFSVCAVIYVFIRILFSSRWATCELGGWRERRKSQNSVRIGVVQEMKDLEKPIPNIEASKMPLENQWKLFN